MRRAVLFDLDGTLTDYARMVAHTLEILAVKVATRTTASAASFVTTYATVQAEDEARQRAGELSVPELRDRARRFGRTLARLGVEDPALTTELASTYAEARRTTAFPLPGARQTLELLAAYKVWVGVVTEGSSREQRGQLAQLGWNGLVSDVVVSEQVGAHKPDPALLTAALANAHVIGRDAVCVGDRALWDLKPARQLGMTTVLFATPQYRDEAAVGRAYVDVEVDSHAALQRWLEGWLGPLATG